jgi:uncharacterized membrane protein YkoI
VPKFSRKTVLAGGTAVLLVGGMGAAAAAANPDDTAESGLTGTALQRVADAAVAAAGGGRVTATDVDDGTYEVEVTLDDGTEVDVQLAPDLTVIGTSRDAPDRAPEQPSAGTPDLARATEAALAAAGGGRVTDADVDDGMYEVEVILDDGTEVDVQLDPDLTVVGTWRDAPDTQETQPLGTPDLAGASEAALSEAGGGRVTDAEVDDDDGTYEVEVILDDGTEVDVQLDPDLTVIGTWRDAPDGHDDD